MQDWSRLLFASISTLLSDSAAVDTANTLSPSPIPSHTLPKGVPGAGKAAKYPVDYDTAKEKRILGLTLRTKEETATDTLADFERRGW